MSRTLAQRAGEVQYGGYCAHPECACPVHQRIRKAIREAEQDAAECVRQTAEAWEKSDAPGAHLAHAALELMARLLAEKDMTPHRARERMRELVEAIQP